MEIKLTALLESFLFVVSSVLFLPVLLSLTFLVFYMFFYLGVFLREYIERKSGHKAFVEAFKEELKKRPTTNGWLNGNCLYNSCRWTCM